MKTSGPSSLLETYTPTQADELILSSSETLVKGVVPSTNQTKSKTTPVEIKQLDKSKQKEIMTTYVQVVKGVIERHMQDFLAKFLKKLNTDQAQDLKNAIRGALDQKNKDIFDIFCNKEPNQYLKDYDLFLGFYKGIQGSIETVSKQSKNHKYDGLLNAAYQGLDTLRLLTKVNAAELLEGLHTIVTVRETKIEIYLC